MLNAVEAWRVGLCALPFDEAQGDSPFNHITVPERTKYFIYGLHCKPTLWWFFHL